MSLTYSFIKPIGIIFLWAGLLLPKSLFSQPVTSPHVEWQRCYGGMDQEHGYWSNQRLGKKLAATSDGGYIFVSTTNSSDGDINWPSRKADAPNTSRLTYTNDDIWVVKVDRLGEIEWNYCFGGSADESAGSIITAADGGYVICGATMSVDGDFPFDTSGLHLSKVFDGFVLKLNKSGQKQWSSRIGGTKFDALYSITASSDGGYAATGYTESKSSSRDGYVVKLSASGEIVWQKSFGGVQWDELFDVAESNSGNIVACGMTVGSSYDAWAIEIDASSQSVLWDRRFSSKCADAFNAIVPTKDGKYILAAEIGDEGGDVVGYHSSGNRIQVHADACLVTMDSHGEILQQKCIGGTRRDMITSLTLTSKGTLAFCGQSFSFDDDLQHTAATSERNIWAGEITTSGELLWQKRLGGSRQDVGSAIVETEGGYVVYATVSSDDGDINYTNGSTDIWMAKIRTQSATASVGSENSASELISSLNVYPNPAIDEIRIEFLSSAHDVRFFDATGKAVSVPYRIHGNRLQADVSGLAGGMYILQVSFKDSAFPSERKKFVKE